MKAILAVLAMGAAVAAVLSVSGKPLTLPVDPRDVPREAQLTVTEAHADLDGDGKAEVILVVNALTGDSDPIRGSEVIFGVAEGVPAPARGRLLWSRHVVAETGKAAHDGEIAAVDLDGDGKSELILTWDQSLSADRTERWGEIYVMSDLSRPRRVWEGSWERDTRSDPETPAAQREWFRRDIDYGATRRAAGQSIVFRKIQAMQGGVRIDPARVESEWVNVALRTAPSR